MLATFAKAAVITGVVILCGGASCATDRTAGSLAEKGLPNLPADLVVDCEDPGVRAGYPLRSELRRNRDWGKCEREKRHDQISFYRDLQAAR
jgi:hypothetical protein